MMKSKCVQIKMCSLCGGRKVNDLMEHITRWHRITTQEPRILSQIIQLSTYCNTTEYYRRKTFPQSTVQSPVRKDRRTSDGSREDWADVLRVMAERKKTRIPPLPKTRSGGGQNRNSFPSQTNQEEDSQDDWIENVPPSNSWIYSVSQPQGSGQDTITVNVDEDISFNIESPRRNRVEGEFTFKENNNTDKDSAEAKEENEIETKAMIATKRAMVTANSGRYLCPDLHCNFRCEAQEILNIHVRNRHVSLWGIPPRKQKMGILLGKVDVDSQMINKAAQEVKRKEIETANRGHGQRDIRRNTEGQKGIIGNKVNVGLKRKGSSFGEEIEVKEAKLEAAVDNTKEKAIKKRLKQLQLGKSSGTFVQCSLTHCRKWRLLHEFEDPALVPDDWECRMNPDKSLNSCDKGNSEDWVEGSEKMVDTKYVAGSMVWAKIKGFPWWPGMVDYCPDTEEYYWLDQWNDPSMEHVDSGTPTHYHVVLFGVPQVSRAWVGTDGLERMVSPTLPPVKVVGSKHRRWTKAAQMGAQCFVLDRQERLERYSFAALYTGKWGSKERGKAEKRVVKVSMAAPAEDVNEMKPSELLNLWCVDQSVGARHNKVGLGHTVLGREGDLVRLGWNQQERVAVYYTERENGHHRHLHLDKLHWGPPSLEPGVTVAVAVATLYYTGETRTTEKKVVACLALLFPFFQKNRGQCARLVRGVFREHGLRPGEAWCPSPALLANTKQQVKLQGNELKRCLLHPLLYHGLLPTSCTTPSTCSPASPGYTDFMLALIGLTLIRHAISVHQLTILLCILFPGLKKDIENFSSRFQKQVCKEKEFTVEVEATSGEKRYKLNEIMRSRSVKLVEDFTAPSHILEKVKQALCHPALMSLLVPSL